MMIKPQAHMLTHFLFLNGPINFSLLVANCRGINEKVVQYLRTLVKILAIVPF